MSVWEFFRRCPTRLEGVVGLILIGLIAWIVATASAGEVVDSRLESVEHKIDRLLELAKKISDRNIAQSNHQEVTLPKSESGMSELIREGRDRILKNKGLIDD